MVYSSSSSTGSSVESSIKEVNFIKNELIIEGNSIEESYTERRNVLSDFEKRGRLLWWNIEDYHEVDGEKIIRYFHFTHCSGIDGYFIGN